MAEAAPPLTLDAWMTKNEITNSDLADALGYNRTMVWKVRAGQRRATGDFQLQFALVYGRAAAAALWPEKFPAGQEEPA